MSKNKLINVAVIGNPKSGKTFVIDAIVRILNQIDKIHKSDRIISNKEVSTNKDLAKILKDYKIINELNDSISNSDLINNLNFLSQDIVSANIHNPDKIKTPNGNNLFWTELILKNNESHTHAGILTFMNIPGEAFKFLFDAIDGDNNPQLKTPSTLLNEIKCKNFFKYGFEENNSILWDTFEKSYKKLFTKFDNQENITKLNDLKKYFYSWIYTKYATDIICCNQIPDLKTDIVTNNISTEELRNLSKDANFYYTITKSDEYFDQLVDAKTNDDLDKFYISCFKKLEEQSNKDDYCKFFNETFSGAFRDKSKDSYYKYLISSCIYHNPNENFTFRKLTKDSWTKASNGNRISLGVKQLISTIFYNNKFSVDELGNLVIYDEFLRNMYYSK